MRGSRDSSVGIATRYGLDCMGIESLCGRDFPHPSGPALGPTQPAIQWVPGLSRGGKAVGRGVDQPSYPAPRLKEEFCSTFGPSLPVLPLNEGVGE